MSSYSDIYIKMAIKCEGGRSGREKGRGKTLILGQGWAICPFSSTQPRDGPLLLLLSLVSILVFVERIVGEPNVLT